MIRKSLLAGAALASLMWSGGAQAGLLGLTLTPKPTASSTDNRLVQPFYGDINPFYGDISPFYGDINPFYGDISPFWGDISPFWGDISPFYGDISPFYGDISPFWGDISPFTTGSGAFWNSVGTYWQDAGPQWGDINSAWANLQATHATNYSSLQAQLNNFLDAGAQVWGAAVKKYTGKNFYSGFANALLAKYGIDPNNRRSLANTSVETRSRFFLDYYDGLMNFTGVDHVDWWMPQVNWSPMLAQTAGTARAVVGVLDSTVDAANADVDHITFMGGYQYYVNDHGAAVASLIAAQQDGHGVMGVAPNSDIHLYNPFDSTGTASWQDVQQGIATLYETGAHVVNASMGVAGTVLSNEWVNILSGPLLSNRRNSLVIVKAAGNEGVAQTQNVPWLLTLEPPKNLILVGSVNPNGQISSFSNTPGNSCFTLLGICFEQNKLMYNFVVAPGELMLVSDNHGGVTRMSGTSFAAPLVTGAVALLQERWPWLKNYATETAQIIFRSAKDLGAPGVDPVYGWGELDIQASQSPLDFDNLFVYGPYSYNGRASYTSLFPNMSARQLKYSVLQPGQLDLWQAQKAYIVAFEGIGLTYRDFKIPLSSLLVGKDQTVNGQAGKFQSYLYQRLIDWAHGTNSLAFNSQTIHAAAGDWKFGFVTTQATDDEIKQGKGPLQTEFVAENAQAGVALRFGQGDGAHAMFGNTAFALRSDFDPATGGVNPVLGLASGGMYANGALEIVDGLKVNVGFSNKSDDHTYIDPTFGPLKSVPLTTSHSNATVAGVEYAPVEGLTFNASYTRLSEADGLLGSQGSGAFALANGADTKSTTVGATAMLTDGWSVSGSASFAKTAASQTGSGLTLTKDGLSSTAFEFAATKTGVFNKRDTMRLSLAQPLHVTNGALKYTAVEVIDRDTGEVGPVTQIWNIAGNPEYRMQAMYSVPVLEGRAAIDGFGLVDLNPPERPQTQMSMSVGAQFRVNF